MILHWDTHPSCLLLIQFYECSVWGSVFIFLSVFSIFTCRVALMPHWFCVSPSQTVWDCTISSSHLSSGTSAWSFTRTLVRLNLRVCVQVALSLDPRSKKAFLNNISHWKWTFSQLLLQFWWLRIMMDSFSWVFGCFPAMFIPNNTVRWISFGPE